MDFKFRLQGQDNNRNTMQERSGGRMSDGGKNSELAGWDKYARKTVPTQPVTKPSSNSPQNIQVTQPQKPPATLTQPTQRSTINRYYRSDIAPKTQYKHYLSDINNIFYEERESLRLLHLYSTLKRSAGLLWLFLFFIFLSLYFITPFEGPCPSNAQCGVFVHCFKGFRYDKGTGECVLSEDLYEKVEEVCTERIARARKDWGDQECEEEAEVIPRIRLDQLVAGIGNQELKMQLVRKLEHFLEDEEKQKNLYFDYFRSSKTIMPNLKSYSWLCSAKLLIKTKNFKLGLPVILILILLAALAFAQLRKRIMAKKIYLELRKRTLAQKLLNISYAKADVEKQYGPIDQKLWELIDENRSKDRDIGFLQDDFLYWKML